MTHYKQLTRELVTQELGRITLLVRGGASLMELTNHLMRLTEILIVSEICAHSLKEDRPDHFLRMSNGFCRDLNHLAGLLEEVGGKEIILGEFQFSN